MTGIDIKPDAQGKVRRSVRSGRQAAACGDGPHLGVDYILEDEIPTRARCSRSCRASGSSFWTAWWRTISSPPRGRPAPSSSSPYADYLRGRFMLVKKADPCSPPSALCAGYLAGSGLKEYQKQGTVCGIQLPEGLKESEKLPEPIYTPPPRLRSATTTRTSATSASWRSSARTTLRSCATLR